MHILIKKSTLGWAHSRACSVKESTPEHAQFKVIVQEEKEGILGIVTSRAMEHMFKRLKW
jgi:hypothetical protein